MVVQRGEQICNFPTFLFFFCSMPALVTDSITSSLVTDCSNSTCSIENKVVQVLCSVFNGRFQMYQYQQPRNLRPELIKRLYFISKPTATSTQFKIHVSFVAIWCWQRSNIWSSSFSVLCPTFLVTFLANFAEFYQ